MKSVLLTVGALFGADALNKVRVGSLRNHVAEDIWIQVQLPHGESKYFNPALGESRAQPPVGALVEPKMALLQTSSKTHHMEIKQTDAPMDDQYEDDDDGSDDGPEEIVQDLGAPSKNAVNFVNSKQQAVDRVIQAPPGAVPVSSGQAAVKGNAEIMDATTLARLQQQMSIADMANQQLAARKMDEFKKAMTAKQLQAQAPHIPDSARDNCHPHCSWTCSNPVCAEHCTPDCEVPVCQTRCPKFQSHDCKVKCDQPQCAVFCPPNAGGDCEKAEDGQACKQPDCETKCEQPKCQLECENTMKQCHSVCAKPQCKWNCHEPDQAQCSKPECKLTCEKPIDCPKQSFPLDAPAPGFAVVDKFNATLGHWEASDKWGKCSTTCGTGVQKREVKCIAGTEGGTCAGEKPAETRECESKEGCMSPCHDWKWSEWGACEGDCDGGMRTRKVWCPCDDEKECVADKPPTQEKCEVKDARCNSCSAVLYGKEKFRGWDVTFDEGEYDSKMMKEMGAKCEDATNLEVIGVCCYVEVFEFGNFNANHKKGFRAKFKEGKFTRSDLMEKGVLDNDISSMKVEMDQECNRMMQDKDDGNARNFQTQEKSNQEETGPPGDAPQRPVGTPRDGDRFVVPWWFWLIFCAVPAAIVVVYFVMIRGA